MICPNCSTSFDDNMSFCPSCGTPANNGSTYQQNGSYQEQNMYQQNGYQYNNPYNSTPYGTTVYPPYQQEKNPTVGQYVGWMLLGTLLGPISLVISIVFAFSSNNKPRATFFKAHLILMAAAAVSIIAIIGFAVLGMSVMEFSDMPVESFGYEYYEELLRIAASVR